MPFSHSAEDEAERWLRALRLHGQVGAALQALGVGEAPLMTRSEPADEPPRRRPLGRAAAEAVPRQAATFAAARGAEAVGTPDVLFAVLHTYGRLFDRALYRRGATRQELLDRLAGVERPAGL